eukprot:1366209-Amphidinium_carterae.1
MPSILSRHGQVAGNSPMSITLMCFRCLGDIEGEPKKYCHNPNRHTVRYLQTLGKSDKRVLRVDAQLLHIMASEFGGSSDFVTSMGPGDSFVMLYSCPSCNTAPLRIRDWLYGRPAPGSSKSQYCAARWKWGTGRQERWVLRISITEMKLNQITTCGEEDALRRSTSFVKTSQDGPWMEEGCKAHISGSGPVQGQQRVSQQGATSH